MLQNIRDNTQGAMAKIIIAIICIPFVLFGIDSLFGQRGVNSIAEVNGEKITAQDLGEEVFLQKRRLLAQMGDNVDPSKLDDNKLKKPALDALVNRKLLLQIANENKMTIADQQINKLITDNPDFQEEGKFSNQRFQTVLGGVGMTAATFKRLFERDLLLAQLSDGVVNTGFMTDKEIEVNTRFTHQSRDIRYIKLSLAKELDLVTVTPEEIREFYDNNPEYFQTEETVIAEYIELKQSDFNPEISDVELKEAYDKEIANFKPEEYREVSHILIEIDDDTSKEQALTLLADIKKQAAEGKNFAELAKEHSDDFGSRDQGGLLGELNEEAFPEEFVAAARKLSKGDISDVVETESGIHLIHLNELSVKEAPSFDERKDKLKQELQTAKAAPAFWAAVEELKDISFNAPDLAEPAAMLKREVQVSSPVKRSGGEGIFTTPAVYNALFTDEMIKEKQNSEVIQIKPDHVAVLHVKEHKPRELESFELVEQRAKEQVTMEKAGKLLADKAEKIKAEIQAGADIEQLANSNSYEWQVHLAAKRTTPGVDRQLINAAFSLPKPPEGMRAVDSVETSAGEYLVFTVSKVKDGKAADVSPAESTAIKNYMAQSSGLKEFKAIESRVKSEAEIKIKNF